MDNEIAQAFSHMARLLSRSQGQGVDQTLDTIAHLAANAVENCEYAGMSLVSLGGRIDTPGASHEMAKTLDAIQASAGEGPCLDAIRTHEVFQVDHLDQETRWPSFSRRAYEATGVTSMLSFRLFIEEDDTMGSLNLYSCQPAAFNNEDSHIAGVIFAAHAAVALLGAYRQRQLEEAVASRDLIGQAKGLLMAKKGVSSDQAFDMLRRASQRLNIKLAKVASDMIAQKDKQ